MSTPGYSDDKAALVTRLHRIEGQVRGIERMIEENRYCIDVLTQISAVNTALESLAFQLLDQHVKHCVAGAFASGDAAEMEQKTAELLEAVQPHGRMDVIRDFAYPLPITVIAEMLGVPVRNVFATLQTYAAGVYVNNINLLGHTFQVIAQGDADYRQDEK